MLKRVGLGRDSVLLVVTQANSRLFSKHSKSLFTTDKLAFKPAILFTESWELILFVFFH